MSNHFEEHKQRNTSPAAAKRAARARALAWTSLDVGSENLVGPQLLVYAEDNKHVDVFRIFLPFSFVEHLG